jgi:hypothetical protein
MGHSAVLRPGEVQVITSGTGMAHGEANASPSETLHLLQMWVIPDRRGLPPRYDQRAFPATERHGRLRLVASATGRDGSLRIHQDADIYVTLLDGGETATLDLASGRGAWVHVARGALRLNGQLLGPGDGAAVEDEATITLAGESESPAGGQPAEAVIFDLA